MKSQSITFILRILFLFVLLPRSFAVPYSKSNDGLRRESNDVRRIGRLAYTLDSENRNYENKGSRALSLLSSFMHDSTVLSPLMDVLRRLSNNERPRAYAVKHAVRRFSTTQLHTPLGNTSQKLESATAFEASLSYDEPTKAFHHSASQKSLKEEAWAETLFGPQGVLTAIFHMIDDRQKHKEPRGSEDARRSIEINPTNTQQHDLPSFLDMDFFKNAKPIDFAKIFQAFLSNSQGDFGDPISELPEFLGICNRLSCGDIYKAIDQFRKSEFFSNFQTAMQLIQDPKGWEIIGDLLSNPELIAQFTNGSGGIEKLLGSVTSATGTKPKTGKNSTGRRSSTDIDPGDGDLGTDFSEMVNEKKPPKEKKPTAEELPEIAENIDGTDYYNAVESGIDEFEQISSAVETVEKPDEVVPISLSKETVDRMEKEELPEISESIDEIGETSIRIDGTDTLVIDKGGSVGEKTTKIHRPLAPHASPTPSFTSTTMTPQRIAIAHNRTTIRYWPYRTHARATLSTTTRAPNPTIMYSKYPTYTLSPHPTRMYLTRTYPTRTYSSSSQRTTATPTTTRRSWGAVNRVTPPGMRTTTKNFRKDSDYYSMYYDDV
ncbi:hypothetical protein Tcan_13577 [Toxocara canis]|uniref:Uncharacterized protein n=1 Tax=Toxocara canis TaxID=6265 RepID=A0A0B2VXU8_TOXCA|nr:hypothetical protein Tcan_13577 [Toxocara canis]